jgi:hypothetical protein
MDNFGFQSSSSGSGTGISGSGTTNYISKFTAASAIGDSQLFDNGSSVGINNNTPTAKLDIKGIDILSTSFSLKITNSTPNDLFRVRNDGFVLVGESTINSYLWTQGLGGTFGFSNENGYPYLYLNSAFSNKFYLSNGGGGGNAFAQINTSNGNWLLGNTGTNVYGAILSDTKLYIQGVDATASNFALKVDNSASTALFYIKNDGVVDIYGTITPRVQSIVSAATVTPTNLNDEVVITAQAVGLTLANPTGTPVQGQSMMIRIKDNGTARAILYGLNYRAIGVTLPTTTVANKIVYLGLIYNSTDTKWDVIGVSQEA